MTIIRPGHDFTIDQTKQNHCCRILSQIIDTQTPHNHPYKDVSAMHSWNNPLRISQLR